MAFTLSFFVFIGALNLFQSFRVDHNSYVKSILNVKSIIILLLFFWLIFHHVSYYLDFEKFKSPVRDNKHDKYFMAFIANIKLVLGIYDAFTKGIYINTWYGLSF